MALQTRLAEFKTRFSNLITGRPQGYDELSNLERPLVGGDDEDDYDGSHGAGTEAYRPPRVAGATDAEGIPVDDRGASFTTSIPTHEDELRELTILGKDAAEILWEMVVLGEQGPALVEMRSNAEQLRAQLRGVIGDYSGADEKIFAGAFEAFEMLSRSLDGEPDVQQQPSTTTPVEQQPVVQPKPTAAVPQPIIPVANAAEEAASLPVSTAPAAVAAKPPVEDVPLISFD